MPTADLHAAFDRLAAFEAVQLAANGRITLEAVLCLQEAVGIGVEERLAIRTWLERRPCRDQGALLLGLVLGLLAADGREG